MADENIENETIEGGVGADTQSPVSDSDFISDEDFMKMTPEQFAARMAESQPGGNDAATGEDTAEGGTEDTGSENGVQQTGEQASAASSGQKAETTPPAGSNAPAAKGTEPKPSQPGSTKSEDNKGEAKSEKKDPTVEPPVTTVGVLPAGVTQEAANEFYKKLTGPIRADGRDITIRSAEDAIRLIQQGWNYSRRMEELKPVKALAQMLSSNGLNDPEKLNFLIDLSKGNKEAIQKLLADHKIDNLDLDSSKAANYKPANYQPNPKDQAFREAVEHTATQEGGNELIADINASWDQESKQALREQPLIFQNLLAQRQSGVYGKIKAELEYQRSLGYFTNIPFLQAYHQVGTAMQNAGAFNPPVVKNEVHSMAPAAQVPVNQGQQQAPIDTGTRKAVVPKNSPAPTNLSSISQPRKTIVSQPNAVPNVPDYAGMSDEEFRKLPPPR